MQPEAGGIREEHTATNVAGRNVIVRMEMDFIAELSRLLATAISRESNAKLAFISLFLWAMKL
jgi:hypothetical protein